MRTLHYPGRLGPDVIGRRRGPNTLGEYLWITEVAYDAETDTTTARLSYQDPTPVAAP